MSSAASSSTGGCSPRWRIPPTTASSRGRSRMTATRSTRSSSSPIRRSRAAGSASARSASSTWRTRRGLTRSSCASRSATPPSSAWSTSTTSRTSCATRSSTSSSATRISSRRRRPRRAAGGTATRRRRSSPPLASAWTPDMAAPEPIDLHHLGRERIIASYLLDTDDGPALFDCGPATTVDALKAGLADRGLSLTDVRHLLLSHIHLDHAGAAGTLVREHPALQVHVSPIGAPHLVDPSRLEASSRRLYPDFDELWGELAPVPEENIRVVGDRVAGLDCFPTQGHARHHVSYLDADGTLYAGDAAGVRIQPSEFVFPPAPPPEFDR